MSRLVVAVSHVEFTETDQTFYVVRVQQDADEWSVRRSYSDFRHLRDDVQRVLKDDKHQLVGDDASRIFARGFHELPFPAKRLFGSKKDSVVKERAVELHHFLNRLLFLTHTYRKAQKQQYDQEGAHVAVTPPGPPSMVLRPQGSASVFYLLRDFLKPALVHSARSETARGRHGGTNATTHVHTDDDEETAAQRMLRESRMLNMRTSHQAKSMSAPVLTSNARSRGSTNASTNANLTTPRRVMPPSLPEEAVASAAVQIEGMQIDNHDGHTCAKTKSDDNKMLDIAELSDCKPHAEPAKPLQVPLPLQSSAHSGSDSAVDLPQQVPPKRFHDRISNADHHPVLRAIGSELDIVPSIPDPQPRSLSTSSTASSTASVHARSYEPTTMATHAASAGTSSSYTGTSLSSSAGHTLRSSALSSSGSTRRRKKKSASSSSLSKAEKDMRNSERLSRLTPQLTAQTITIDAQKELEKHVSEYNAIMVMRYVDRFISKAVAKTPGCYTVLEKRLVIDSDRFVEELEEVFHDLPSDIRDAFKNANGEWLFPKALDAYVQMKWNSFQGKSVGSTNGSMNGTFLSSSKASDSEGEDSDSDFEYQDTGGYMKRKDRRFTQDESDVLQQMIADGTAGNEQMLRLRRQFDEKGWQRRTNPGAKIVYQQSSSTYDDGSDTDDDSGNESIKRFQEQQNAMRKSRMSRHDMGGLV